MKNKFLAILFVIPSLAYSQEDKVTLPEKNGSIIFEEIKEANIAKSELFTRAQKWVADTYVDSKEVVRISDKENGHILGSGSFNVHLDALVGSYYKVQYMIDIAVKENKYRIQLYQFLVKYKSPQIELSNGNLEKYWNDSKEAKRVKKDYRKLFIAVEKNSTRLLNSFDTSMSTLAQSDNF